MALGTTGITTAAVGTALGSSSRDVGTLCKHSSINKWAKGKPVPYPSDTGVTDHERRFCNQGFDLNSVTSISISQLLSSAQANKDWTYIKPSGGANSPYRLGDFRGYNHNAVPPYNFNSFPVNTLVGYKNKDVLDKLIQDNCVFYDRKVDENMIPTDIIKYFDKPKKYDFFKTHRVWEDVIAESSGKLFATLRTICSGNIEQYEVDDQKITWLNDLLDCINDRLVIFYNFNVERDRIISLLEKKKIPFSEYSGRTKTFDEFKNNEKSVILCQFKSASTGLNDLVIASKCVFYSPCTEYIDYAQSRKRLDRIGQTEKPLFYYLICKGTVEEKILRSIQEGKDFDTFMFDAYINGRL